MTRRKEHVMATDTISRKMSQAGSGQAPLKGQQPHPNRPRTGEHFRCEVCGMEVEITAGCTCQVDHPHLECCGQSMAKA
jgi:hypothetical protein